MASLTHTSASCGVLGPGIHVAYCYIGSTSVNTLAGRTQNGCLMKRKALRAPGKASGKVPAAPGRHPSQADSPEDGRHWTRRAQPFSSSAVPNGAPSPKSHEPSGGPKKRFASGTFLPCLNAASWSDATRTARAIRSKRIAQRRRSHESDRASPTDRRPARPGSKDRGGRMGAAGALMQRHGC